MPPAVARTIVRGRYQQRLHLKFSGGRPEAASKPPGNSRGRWHVEVPSPRKSAVCAASRNVSESQVQSADRWVMRRLGTSESPQAWSSRR